MITPAIYYISSYQDATSSSQTPVETLPQADLRIWDQKNLNVTSYRDGTIIPEVKTGWSTLKTGAWRYYNDNPASAAVYGRLYNWYALMGIAVEESSTPTTEEIAARKNIAPIGWEVATFGEWITLRNALGVYVAAVALKENGTSHWLSPNTGTNSSGFTALPGGYKTNSDSTTFIRLSEKGFWWSRYNQAPRYLSLTNVSNALAWNYYSSTGKNLGLSIRLIKPTGVIPNFITTYPEDITPNSFLGIGGDIPTDYSGQITERGIVYGTSENPTIANTKIEDVADGVGLYTLNMTGLSNNTEYHIRAYAISSSIGLTYATNLRVFTPDIKPIVYTNGISQILTNFAVSGGYVEYDGGYPITSKGVCWNKTGDPTISSSKTITVDERIEFVGEITGLELNTKYYVRAYARNAYSTGYGNPVEFTTLAVPSLNLIFNQYESHHAYSLRKLSDTYNYKCLRVRRQTTTYAGVPSITTTFVDVLFNTDIEIGLHSDILYASGDNTIATTLGEFAASVNNGYDNVDGVNQNQNIFITIWYDQSGNGINVRNNTTTGQPKIVSNGALQLDLNNKPGVKFSGAQVLSISNSSTRYNNESVYVVGSATSIDAMSLYSQGHGDANYRMFIGRTDGQDGGIWYNNNVSLYQLDFPTPLFMANVPSLYELICSASTTSAYFNGTQLLPPSIPSVDVTNAFIKIGAVGNPSIYANGLIQEVICLVSTPSRESISPNIMDYYEIPKPPLVITADVNYTEPTGTAIGGGNVTEDFGATVTKKGVCWNTLPNPSVGAGAETNDGAGLGSFTSTLNFLSAYTKYYVRAYGTHFSGIGYGPEKEFTTGNAPTSLILDLFPSAHHAYSLRKLRTAYTGACLRIRRTTTSPNPVTTTSIDVSFDSNGTISFNSPLVVSSRSGTFTNATTLGQFAQGTVDGLTAHSIINVVTWYDQSGNGKNPTQATEGYQPILVRLDSGVATLETSGGKVAVRFTKASSQFLSMVDTTANINNMSSYFVGQFVTTVTGQIGYLLATGNRFYMPYSNGSYFYAGYDSSPTTIRLQTSTSTDRKLFELLAPSPLNSAVAQGWMNGVAQRTEPIKSSATTAIQIGTGATNYYDGYIQEVIGWQSNTYRGQKEMNINLYWQIY